MTDDFLKLYDSFFTGTIAETDPATRIVFLACCKLCDSMGYFRATPAFIQKFASVTPEQCEAALEILQAPDPNSTSPDAEGRRIVQESPNCWKVVNYGKYRGRKTRQEYMRDYMKEHRRKQRDKAETDSKPPPALTPLTNVNPLAPIKLELDKNKKNTIGGKAKRTSADFEAFKAEYPKRDGDYGWKKAGETFERLIKNGTPVEEILAGVKRYKLHCLSRQICGTKYVKHATTFLNGAFWKETYDIIAEAQSIVLPKEDRDYYVVPVTYVDGEERGPGSEVTQEERRHADIRQANIPYSINESGRTSERFVLSEWFEEKGIHGVDARWDGCKFVVARSKMD